MNKHLPDWVHLDRSLWRLPTQICHRRLHDQTLCSLTLHRFPRQRWIWYLSDSAAVRSSILPAKFNGTEFEFVNFIVKFDWTEFGWCDVCPRNHLKREDEIKTEGKANGINWLREKKLWFSLVLIKWTRTSHAYWFNVRLPSSISPNDGDEWWK